MADAVIFGKSFRAYLVPVAVVEDQGQVSLGEPLRGVIADERSGWSVGRFVARGIIRSSPAAEEQDSDADRGTRFCFPKILRLIVSLY